MIFIVRECFAPLLAWIKSGGSSHGDFPVPLGLRKLQIRSRKCQTTLRDIFIFGALFELRNNYTLYDKK